MDKRKLEYLINDLPIKQFTFILFLALLIFFLRLKTASQHSGENWVNFYNDKGQITLIGMVAEPPEVEGKWQRIKITKLVISENAEKFAEAQKRHKKLSVSAHFSALQRLQGKILVKTRLYPKFHYGDIIQLSGELKTPPEFEDFSYKEYLEIDGIYSLMDFPKIQQSAVSSQQSASWESYKTLLLMRIYSLREKFEQIINQILPEPHASLLAGILFGIERSYEQEFYANMQKSGVLHIIVASGYNIMIVSSFFLGLAPIFGRRKNLVVAALGVLIYAVIAGMQPPIVRAAIMGGGVMLAEAFGRRKDALLWFFLAGILMLFANPLLYKSVSFQLSFGAALGLLLFNSYFQKLLRQIPGIFRESLSTTLAVQIFTLPIIFFSFHEASPVALVVNTLVLETIPIIMGLGVVATAGGLFSISLGRVLAFPAWAILSYFVKVVEVLT